MPVTFTLNEQDAAPARVAPLNETTLVA
jgi:hypothetical protein